VARHEGDWSAGYLGIECLAHNEDETFIEGKTARVATSCETRACQGSVAAHVQGYGAELRDMDSWAMDNGELGYSIRCLGNGYPALNSSSCPPLCPRAL
jgi:hypothetical protein